MVTFTIMFIVYRLLARHVDAELSARFLVTVAAHAVSALEFSTSEHSAQSDIVTAGHDCLYSCQHGVDPLQRETSQSFLLFSTRR
jgi:hypothetical protein